ncbi:MAG: hypothetical protein Athens101426_352 [Parcubacteria group bacterium Athens1014_26]|nr:MAG: hypothetical protein Athens101426_352 [Parcubacteria group bacterium Athens1014_26]
MEIKFIELLDKTGDAWKALFDVDGKSVIIGVSDTLVSIWGIQRHKNPMALFLKQFGSLKIQWMLAEENVQDYMFVSDHFKKEDGQTMTLGELDDYLKDKIIEVEEKSKSIGFKVG